MLLLVHVIFSGCITEGIFNVDQLPSDKYVVLEETNTTICAIYEGNYGLPGLAQPIINVDYAYVREHGPANIEINDSLKIAYFNSNIVGIPGRYYGSTPVYGVYSLPYEVKDTVNIICVYQNGTVHFEYGDQQIFLMPGDEWQAPLSSWVMSDSGLSLNMTPWEYKASCNSTRVIKNMGVFDKSVIKPAQ